MKQKWKFHQRWHRRYFRLKGHKLYYAKDAEDVSLFHFNKFEFQTFANEQKFNLKLKFCMRAFARCARLMVNNLSFSMWENSVEWKDFHNAHMCAQTTTKSFSFIFMKIHYTNTIHVKIIEYRVIRSLSMSAFNCL